MRIWETWYMRSTWTARRRCSLTALVGVIVALCAAVLVAPPAGAQNENPYGSTSTTAPDQPTASCSIDQSSGVQGGVVSGTLFDIEAGSTAEFYLGGVLLGTIEAPDGPQTFRRAPIAATVDVAFSFGIPADLAPGMYTPIVVGSTFNAECALPGGAVAFEVLAASDGDGDGDDDLAFTGFEILFLVLLGLLLIAVGYAIVRRRRNYAT